jgi:hypothetical protein
MSWDIEIWIALNRAKGDSSVVQLLKNFTTVRRRHQATNRPACEAGAGHELAEGVGFTFGGAYRISQKRQDPVVVNLDIYSQAT